MQALIHNVFGLCALLSFGMLLTWFVMIVTMRDWIYKKHSAFFCISREEFDSTMYKAIIFYKTLAFLLFIVPWLAMTILR